MINRRRRKQFNRCAVMNMPGRSRSVRNAENNVAGPWLRQERMHIAGQVRFKRTSSHQLDDLEVVSVGIVPDHSLVSPKS